MSVIQTGRYEQFVRRLFRIVDGGVLPRLQNDVSPVLAIEDEADDALLFWKGHRLANGRATGTAAAGENGACSIFNPLGTGVLVWVRTIRTSTSNAAVIRCAFTQDRTSTVQSTLFFSDSRASLITVPRAELGFDSLAALPDGGFSQFANTGRAGENWHPRYVLAPGVGLQIINQTQAEILTVGFEWIERSAEDSELLTG